ncbi:MAG: hypothetical protein ACREMM_10370 [Gemmatimonadales bacterium]
MHAFSSYPATRLDPPQRLAEQDYERLDRLLGKHFAEFATEIIKLAAFCWAMVLVPAVVLVLAVMIISAVR